MMIRKNAEEKKFLKLKKCISKNQKGITLIALVVTIVVLLILAGVTITFVLGEGGILNMAKKAADETKNAIANDQADMESLVGQIDELLNDGNTSIEQVTDTTPGDLSGKGTQTAPYLIESIEDLVKLSSEVESGNKYEGKVVKLNVNLDFNSDKSYVNTSESKTELTTGSGFKPIGISETNSFNGTFNGGKHVIKNLYISGTGSVGLFGYTGENSSIKNITMIDVNIKTTGSNAGAIVGRSKGTIENAKTEGGKIEGNVNVGGIVGLGNKSKIISCINNSEVTGNLNIGGIAGWLENSSKIENISNNGTITGNGSLMSDNLYHVQIGGIAGWCDSSEISNCANNGKIIGVEHEQKSTLFGGIVGTCLNNSLIYLCYNDVNIGNLEDNTMNVGGIVGCSRNNCTISSCFNLKEIAGREAIGGIAGLVGWQSTAYIYSCYNIGEINARYALSGGICNIDSNSTRIEIKNCYNIGKVPTEQMTDKTRSGSIAGLQNGTDTANLTIKNCYYLQGTCEGGINLQEVKDQAEAKSEAEMKEESFVDTLNKENEKPVWKKDKNGRLPSIKIISERFF